MQKNIQALNVLHNKQNALIANYPTGLIAHHAQEQIRKKMQELKITYREARDILQGNKSYAQIVLMKQQPRIIQQSPSHIR